MSVSVAFGTSAPFVFFYSHLNCVSPLQGVSTGVARSLGIDN